MEIGAQNVLTFGESMSSDLEFFLKIPVTLFPEKLVHAKTVNQGCMLSGDSAAAITTIVVQNLDVEEHKVSLSANMLLLIDCLGLFTGPAGRIL